MRRGDSAERPIVLVLTALEVEYRAVRAHLRDMRTETHERGTQFEVGTLPGSPRRIVLGLTSAGNTGAAIIAERAIDMFKPELALFVGVAGALHSDLTLGQVVVATRVYVFHGGREGPTGFAARPRVWEASHRPEHVARQVARSGVWVERVVFRPIAAGEVVIDSTDGWYVSLIGTHYEDAGAVEMESGGSAQAAHLNDGLPALTIRGISDRADGRKYQADGTGWQRRASAAAAAFAADLCRGLPAPTGRWADTHQTPHPTPPRRDTAPQDVPDPLRALPGLLGGGRRGPENPTPSEPPSDSVPSAVWIAADETLLGDLGELPDLLAAGNLVRADIATTGLLLDAVDRRDVGYLTPADGHRLRRDLLAALDSVWGPHTDGKHGFRAQLGAYPGPADPSEAGQRGDFRALGQALGWREDGVLRIQPYREFVGGGSHPPGFFPTLRNPEREQQDRWREHWVETAMAVHLRLREVRWRRSP